MDNENKWEYDYSSEHSQTGETGYPNVGSSGMNTANTAGTYGEAAQADPQADPNSGSDGGAVPPPEGPRYQAAQGSPKQPPKKRRRKNGNIARSAVALVLAAAMGFVGGFVGARVGNTGGKVVIQQAAPSSTSSSDSGSASAVNTASGMQTPTLAIICSRYLENKAFKPATYFRLKLSTAKEGTEFTVLSTEKFDGREKAEAACAEVIGARTVRVVNVERKEAREQPPLLYDLTTLQKEANSRYGFSAEKTLDIAQSLYEKKFITYPRTGSRYISEDVAEEIPALIGNMTRYPRFAEYAGRMDTASLSRRSVDNEKIADHHALLPTENLPSELDADHRIVYEMVAGRMLETFSGACVKENTSLTLQSAGHDFTARGSIMVETGWRAVLNEPVEEKEEDMTLLPDIVQGDELPVKGCVTEQKQTRPRPLHTESSLLAAMETAGRELSDEAEREAMKDAGIGTPATRAAIIETLFAREYVRREKKSLVPTDKGLAVYAVVKDKKIADVAMTGGWELALSKIATGEMDAPTFHRGIEVFASQIAKELLEARIDGAESDTACPRCGRPVVFYPKLAKCQNPDCGLTVWRTVARKELTDKQLAELLTKGKTGTIRGFVKNGGGTFDAALTLDDQFKTSFVFEPRDTPRQGKRNKRK